MTNRHARSLVLAVLLALGACGPGQEAGDPTSPSPAAPSPTTAPSEPSPKPTVQDIAQLEDFADLEPGTYFIDPDKVPSTPLRVFYEVPAEGWSQWIGAVKFNDVGHVAVSITTVDNLVRHGCRDHSPADPPVGSSVDDLATGLADLAPFRVTSPPKGVTIYGYRGKHLELTVPDLPVEGEEFAECVDGNLSSWIDEPGGEAFYGYGASPRTVEEFWILDVDGIRLMVAAIQVPGSPQEDASEMRAILDSIRIEP